MFLGHLAKYNEVVSTVFLTHYSDPLPPHKVVARLPEVRSKHRSSVMSVPDGSSWATGEQQHIFVPQTSSCRATRLTASGKGPGKPVYVPDTLARGRENRRNTLTDKTEIAVFAFYVVASC